MDKTWRRNFANRTHLRRLVLQSGLCFMGTCKLLAAAPVPSYPSKPPVKKDQSCCSLRGTPGGKGGWEEKGEIPCEIKVSKRSFKKGKLQPCSDVMLQERVQSPFHGDHFPGQVSVEQLSFSFSPSASPQATFVNALFSIPYPFAAMLSGTLGGGNIEVAFIHQYHLPCARLWTQHHGGMTHWVLLKAPQLLPWPHAAITPKPIVGIGSQQL